VAYGKGVLRVVAHLAHTTPSSLKMGNKTKTTEIGLLERQSLVERPRRLSLVWMAR
jgi:hypothetical protein